jgi:ribosome-associated toxin RatA of RatAB toxin-antitoxin module
MTYFLLFLVIGGTTLVWTRDVLSKKGNIEASVKRYRRKGRILFEIQASGLVRATQQQTWAVLTDYTRLSEFVPGLQSSKLLSRSGDEVIIEQQGSIDFLFRQQAIHLVVRVTEHPFSRLDVALVKGDMKHYASRWKLEPAVAEGGTRIDYHGSMELNFFVPLVLGRILVQADVQKMLAAVVAEVERRS